MNFIHTVQSRTFCNPELCSSVLRVSQWNLNHIRKSFCTWIRSLTLKYLLTPLLQHQNKKWLHPQKLEFRISSIADMVCGSSWGRRHRRGWWGGGWGSSGASWRIPGRRCSTSRPTAWRWCPPPACSGAPPSVIVSQTWVSPHHPPACSGASPTHKKLNWIHRPSTNDSEDVK